MANKKTTIADGAYTNFATGLGQSGLDKSEETRAAVYHGTSTLELARMAVQDGVADRIVTMVPESSFAQDISIIGDEKGELLDMADGLGLMEAIETAGEFQRLSGGAVIVTEYSDVTSAADLKKPVSKGAQILGYRTYSAGVVNLDKKDFYGDDPKRFEITSVSGDRFVVDASRVTVVHGKQLPQELGNVNLREGYFGISVLKKCEKAIKDYAAVMGAVTVMANETGSKLFSLENFNELLSRPDTGIRDAKELISLVSYSLSACRSAFMGPNDKITFMSHNFAGLPEIIREQRSRICAGCGIPESLLFGRTATGLGQSNDADIKSYVELCNKWRKRYMYRPAVSLLSDLAARSGKRNISGSFVFGAVDVMSEKEMIEARTKQAETMNKYYQMGVLSAEEIRKGVFVNGHSFEISVEE